MNMNKSLKKESLDGNMNENLNGLSQKEAEKIQLEKELNEVSETKVNFFNSIITRLREPSN